MQNNKIFTDWLNKKKSNKKSLAVLIDPDKSNEKHLSVLCAKAKNQLIDYFFVGGSLLTTNNLDLVISYLKINSDIPVVLFPGNTMQVNLKADGILFLSLISGRNSELLIGKHVEVAPLLHSSSLEIISTGYMLIESGKPTSVAYISNTNPIPSNKAEIAVSTALAGEMLGLKSIYLEAGSGAERSVPLEMVAAVKSKTSAPLIVGGGINTVEKALEICKSGADIIVIGTKIERDHSFIDKLAKAIHQEKSII